MSSEQNKCVNKHSLNDSMEVNFQKKNLPAGTAEQIPEKYLQQQQSTPT